MSTKLKPDIPVAVWVKGHPIPGFDPGMWRRDDHGFAIRFWDYGDRSSDFGWEQDHITRVADGGSNHISNLRPLNWHVNAARG